MIEIIPNWHPIFVHFTVALLLVSLGLYLLGLIAKCEPALLVARWNLWIGAGLTAFTVGAGMYAFNTVDHDTPSHLAMLEHRNLAFITVAILLPLVLWSWLLHKKAKPVGWGFAVVFIVLGAMLLSTAWHGAELVYRHGLGVMSLPDVDAHDHGAHDHAAGGHGAHGDDDHHAAGHGDHPSIDDDMSMGDMSMDEGDVVENIPDTNKADNNHHHDDGHAHEHHH